MTKTSIKPILSNNSKIYWSQSNRTILKCLKNVKWNMKSDCMEIIAN